ncbi:MAG: hypothetical protein ABI345_02860 [Jatrophihabitans sp.]
MSGLAQAIKEIADKVATALGHDAAQAEKRLMHGTGDRLEANVKAHVEHDGHAAQELERAAGKGRTIPTTHGGGESSAHATGARGPALREPPTVGGGGGEHSGLGLPGEQPLNNPTQKLSKADHTYLQSNTRTRENEAIPGGAPDHSATVAPRPNDNYPALPLKEINNFDGPVDPYTLRAGTTYVRSVGDGTHPNGSYWSEHVPNGEAGLRSDYAVRNEWNGDHGVVTFTPHEDMPIGWGGRVAPQPATGDPGSYLPGGAHQIWIPDGRSEHGIGADDGTWTIAPMPGEAQ